MKLPIYQIDAFASDVFRGNPAAIVPLEQWLEDATMQAIASENNLAETAFFVREPSGWRIRWFTPALEIDLCGHATLASGWLLMEHLKTVSGSVTFASASGPLTVTQADAGRLQLEFPSRPGTPLEPAPALLEGLGARPLETLKARDVMAVFGSEDELLALRPNFDRLADLDTIGIIATAPGRDVDFVSRFFAPRAGINEDPVTGSAHCTLIPYWAKRLGRSSLRARQVSPRGGDLWCALQGERVLIGGHAVLYLEGSIEVPAAVAAARG